MLREQYVCRKRHLKCDETKPGCTRCQKAGYRCDGYPTVKQALSRKSIGNTSPAPRSPRALPVLPEFDDQRQKQFFAFFVSCTSDASSLYFGADFWARRVLQLSLSEASIRYALCSLSALHRITSASAGTDVQLSVPELRSYALQQYNLAVRCTQILLAESSDGSQDKILKGLVACVLFVCYETFTGNHQVSHMHLQNGLQIITRECHKSPNLAIPKDIIQVFKRLDLQAITSGDSNVPYPYHLINTRIDFLTQPSARFESIEDSFDVVLRLCRWMFTNVSSDGCPVPPEELSSAKLALQQWDLEIQRFTATELTKANKLSQRPIALLKLYKMYQIIMKIMLSIGVYRRETLHDNFLSKYQELIALGEELIPYEPDTSNKFFCFDIGVIFPMFWVAIKCRDAQIRRRAIKLLSSMHHQEGAWKATTATRAAEVVIAMEEEGLPQGVSPHQVPETSRIHYVNTSVDVGRNEIHLSCLVRSNIDDVSWYTRDRIIPYEGKYSPPI